MSAAHLTDEQLQRLHDGEIAGGALRRAQAHVAACAECRTAIDALGSLRRLLREHLGAPESGEAGTAALGGLAERVARRIDDPARPAHVISLGERLRVRGQEEIDERGRSWVAVIVAVAAALAVVATRPFWAAGAREAGSHVIAIESGMMPSIVLNLFDRGGRHSTAVVWVGEPPADAAPATPEEPQQAPEPQPPPGSATP